MHQLKILRGGQLSSVQDAGRPGFQALGVTPGGALDTVALRVGNWLVGNAGHQAAIEITWAGPRIGCTEDTLIAATGAAAAALSCAGVPVPGWRPVWIRKGGVLEIGQVTEGARLYLCVQGGIDAPAVLGGLGTDLRNCAPVTRCASSPAGSPKHNNCCGSANGGYSSSNTNWHGALRRADAGAAPRSINRPWTSMPISGRAAVRTPR